MEHKVSWMDQISPILEVLLLVCCISKNLYREVRMHDIIIWRWISAVIFLTWLFYSSLAHSQQFSCHPKCLGKSCFEVCLVHLCYAINFYLQDNFLQFCVSVCHVQLLIRSVSQGHPDCRLYHFLLGGSLCCFKTYWSVDAAKEAGWCHQIRFIISWGHRSKSPAWTCCSQCSSSRSSHLWWTVIHFWPWFYTLYPDSRSNC